MRVSNSKLNTWRRCPNRYRYKYVEKLRPKERKVQLERGTWLHDLLMHYYDGEDWKARHKELTREFYALFEEEREDLGNLPAECLRIMRSYLRHYPDDFDRFRVIDSELDEIVVLPNGLELQIVVDLVVEDRRSKLIWPWDHKTRKNFVDSDSMILDPQLTLYYYGLEQLGYGKLGGVVYNEISTKPPTVPEVLARGGLSKRKNIATDPYTYLSEIRRLGLDPSHYSDILAHIAITSKNRYFRRTYLPKDPPVLKQVVREMVWSAAEMVTAEKKSRFPRTMNKECKWDCDFKDVCLAELHGADPEPLIKMNFIRKPKSRKDDEK